MNHCDYQIIEISPKALFIESGVVFRRRLH